MVVATVQQALGSGFEDETHIMAMGFKGVSSFHEDPSVSISPPIFENKRMNFFT